MVTAEYGEAVYLSFIFVVAKNPLPVLNHKNFCSFLSCAGFSFYLLDFSSPISFTITLPFLPGLILSTQWTGFCVSAFVLGIVHTVAWPQKASLNRVKKPLSQTGGQRQDIMAVRAASASPGDTKKYKNHLASGAGISAQHSDC